MLTQSSKQPSFEPQNVRLLYSLYRALAREFVIQMQPCRELEEDSEVSPIEAGSAAEKWLVEMDDSIQIHQLRQFLQTSSQINEEVLGALLAHHLNKRPRTEQDRDKVDFLLVQLLSERAPSDLSGPSLTVEEAAKILEPALGRVEIAQPEWLTQLEDLRKTADQAQTLKQLFTSRIIEHGRQVKLTCGDKFFEPAPMVAFARFGFLVRRAFFRLLHQDLNITLDGLRELEARGVTTLDCRKAQFSAEEPVARLRMICQSWKVMFQAEYSSGQPLCILVDLRTAVEAALAKAPAGGALKAQTAAAGGSGNAQEFEVGAPAWDGDAADNPDA
jgi:hypothetical protein